MHVIVRMPYAAWRQALKFFQATPDPVLTATAGIREREGEFEYLVSRVALERPLFRARSGPAPRIRITRLQGPESFEAMVKTRRSRAGRQGDASRYVADLALSPSQGFRGVFWTGNRPAIIRRLEIPGRSMLRLHHGQGPRPPARGPGARGGQHLRFSREIGAFGGPRVFSRFRDSTFCIIGAGRTGSLVAHSLARMEPRRIVLVDPDRLEDHNVPSMDIPVDAPRGKEKVEAVAAFLRSVNARCEVETHASPVISAESPATFDAVAGADVIISAVDHSQARLEASLLATLFLRPHLDVGTGILNFGGRRRAGYDVRLIVPGDGCLLCVGGLPGVDRQRPRDFRQERAGSSRFLNMEAVGHGLRLVSRLYEGTLALSLWHRLEEEPGGGDQLTVMDQRMEERCALCRYRGMGNRAAGQTAGLLASRAAWFRTSRPSEDS